jgi:lia operon protein LiaG
MHADVYQIFFRKGDNPMKTDVKKMILLLAVITAVMLVISIAFAGQDSSGGWHFGNVSTGPEKDIDETKETPIGNIDSIDASTISEEIKVYSADNDVIKARLYGSSNLDPLPELVIENTGGKLTIKISTYTQNRINFNIFGRNKLKMEIYIPKAYTGDLKIGTVSGSVAIDAVNVGQFDLTSTSGSFTAGTINSADSSIKTVSGSASVDAFTGNLVCSTVSGSLKVIFAKFDNDIKANSVSGSCMIKLPAGSQFNITAKSTSGNVESNFILDSVSRKSSHNIEGSVGTSDNDINVTTVSGSIDISN